MLGVITCCFPFPALSLSPHMMKEWRFTVGGKYLRLTQPSIMDEDLNAALIKKKKKKKKAPFLPLAEDHVWNTCPAITKSTFTCGVVLICKVGGKKSYMANASLISYYIFINVKWCEQDSKWTWCNIVCKSNVKQIKHLITSQKRLHVIKVLFI